MVLYSAILQILKELDESVQNMQDIFTKDQDKKRVKRIFFVCKNRYTKY